MRTEDQAQVLRQLALLFNSGLQLAQSLEVIARGDWDETTATGLESMEQSLYQGRTLSQAMAGHFDRVVVGLARIGEETGSMAGVLERGAELMERNQRINRQLRGALIYPLFLAGACFLTLVAMMLYFVPRMAEFVSSFQVKLAWPVELLFRLAAALANPWFVLGAVETLAAAGVLVFLWARTDTGRRLLTRASLRVPVLGRILIISDLLRVSFGLTQTQACGYPLASALTAIAQGLANAEIADGLRRAHKELVDGETLAVALSREEFFQGPFLHLLAAGEEVGRLEIMIRAASRLYEEELQQRIDTFTALLEPLLMIVMGFIVGGTILLLFLPMAQIVQQL